MILRTASKAGQRSHKWSYDSSSHSGTLFPAISKTDSSSVVVRGGGLYGSLWFGTWTAGRLRAEGDSRCMCASSELCRWQYLMRREAGVLSSQVWFLHWLVRCPLGQHCQVPAEHRGSSQRWVARQLPAPALRFDPGHANCQRRERATCSRALWQASFSFSYKMVFSIAVFSDYKKLLWAACHQWMIASLAMVTGPAPPFDVSSTVKTSVKIWRSACSRSAIILMKGAQLGSGCFSHWCMYLVFYVNLAITFSA